MHSLKKTLAQTARQLKRSVSGPHTNLHTPPTFSSPDERMNYVLASLEQLQKIMFLDIPEGLGRQDLQFFDRLYKCNGPLRSTADFSVDAKIRTEVYFHHRDKAEVALTVGSSWYGGDYFEFGAQDLNTFRNMLSAYDICGMTKHHPDVRFYAFDVFGDPTANAPKKDGNALSENFEAAFGHYLHDGDQMKLHQQYIKEHNLYRDQCYLVQGLFENTLSDAFKKKYQSENRKIGYAFLDCNVAASYRLVFDFIFDLMAVESYIYMDEYFQNPAVTEYYRQFCEDLRTKRNMGSVYIRNAGGFGGLFRLYPLGVTDGRYDIR